MIHCAHRLKVFAKRWVDEQTGVAAVEAALIFPIMLVLLLGTFDMANAILANQKAIRSSQVVADLVTRARTVSANDINEAVKAGELAFSPMSPLGYGVDVASISFDDDAAPAIVFRETRNMSANADVLDDVASLAEPNGGVVAVTVEYTFTPVFAGFILDEFVIQEIAFARGRKSAVVRPE